MNTATNNNAQLVRITTSAEKGIITKLIIHITLPKSKLQTIAANGNSKQKQEDTDRKQKYMVTLKVPVEFLRLLLSKTENIIENITENDQRREHEHEVAMETFEQEEEDEIDRELNEYFQNNTLPSKSQSSIDPILEKRQDSSKIHHRLNGDETIANKPKRRKSSTTKHKSSDIKKSNPSSRKNSTTTTTLSSQLPTQVDSQISDKALNYRQIPKNIIPLLKQDLLELNDDDEELGIVNKIIFSLIDPLSASKIKFPVKPTKCIHFECFDYETFCLFNKIPSGIVHFIKTEMINKNRTRLKNISLGKPMPKKQQQQQQQQQKPKKQDYIEIIDEPKFFNNPNIKSKFIAPILPNYKCPLCDQKFFLSDLEIFDSFNYFVKSTPNHTNRIELVDMDKYRIIEDISHTTIKHDEDLIVLSDHESDIDIDTHNPSPNDSFDDDLDEALLQMSNHLFQQTASGSWDDPIEL